jgi:cyclohexa-1,5-dienecarbonyl-CoA hydratase
VLVLSARGKHFSAGASIDEHLPPLYERMLNDFTETVHELVALDVPLIATVQGRCLGGAFELVQAADMIVAADNAWFGQPEIQLGVFAPIAAALLPKRIGSARAAEVLFTGEPVTAQQLFDAGMVTRVVALEELDASALSLAQRVARHSRTSLMLLKRAMRAQDIGQATQLYVSDLMHTHDALEGLQSFVEKRSPVWSHQ